MFPLQDHQIENSKIVYRALELGKLIRFQNEGFQNRIYSPDDALTTIIKIDNVIFKPTLH